MAKKPRRYYSLINIDYDKIPLKYGEDQLKLPQMVIVLEMIKNGDIIIETLNPEDEDFLEKFYEQRNEVEVKNMKALSIHDTIFQGGLGLQKEMMIFRLTMKTMLLLMMMVRLWLVGLMLS